MFGEDLDWCYRVKQRDWQIYYLGDGASCTTREPRRARSRTDELALPSRDVPLPQEAPRRSLSVLRELAGLHGHHAAIRGALGVGAACSAEDARRGCGRRRWLASRCGTGSSSIRQAAAGARRRPEDRQHDQCAGLSDVGQKRAANEDRCPATPEAGICILADGMGGKLFGEVASQMAVDIITQHVRDDLPKSCHRLDRFAQSCMAVNLMDEWIRDANHADLPQGPHARRARSAAWARRSSACSCFERQMVMAHVGDSRCYRLRKGVLKQLTDDHSLVASQVKSGQLYGRGGARGDAQEHHHARDRHVRAREAGRRRRPARGPRPVPPLLGRPHRHGDRRRSREAARRA